MKRELKKKPSSKRKTEAAEISPVQGRGCLWWKRFFKR